MTDSTGVGSRHQRVKEMRNRGRLTALGLVVAFTLALAVAGAFRPIAWMLLGGYLLVSVATVFAYWGDKRAAQQGRWRTSESRLQLMGLFGGWPGALLAQQLFRHKTKKVRFRLAFWATVIVNVVVTAWIVSAVRPAM